MADEPDGYYVPPALYARLVRVADAFDAGLLTNRPPAETPGRGGGARDKVGRTKEPIDMGKRGMIVRLKGEPEAEEEDGEPFEAYNHWGDLSAEQRVLYSWINGVPQIKQARCHPETDDEIFDYIAKTHNTVYHPSCTVKMGPDSDALAPVDPQLRVRGVDGLRVADGSIMPDLITVNPCITTMMIGERCADFIRRPR